jgi:hypothetical protein
VHLPSGKLKILTGKIKFNFPDSEPSGNSH